MIQFLVAVFICPRKKILHIIQYFFSIQSDRTLDVRIGSLLCISCNNNRISGVVLQSDLLLCISCRAGFILTVVFPVSYIIMLKESCRQVLCKCLCNIRVIILISAPSFKAIQTISAKQRVVGCSAIPRIVQNLRISLVIAEEPDNLTIPSFQACSAISGISCPVRPGRIIFSLVTKLCGESPSE